MKAFIALIQPVLFTFFTSKEVKELVIRLLDKYVKTTDNQIDDVLVRIVEDKLFTAEE
jgi:hypothetical protein